MDTVKGCWEAYKEAQVPGFLEDWEMEHIRKAFFAGSLSTLSMVIEAAMSNDSEGAVEKMDALQEELVIEGRLFE